MAIERDLGRRSPPMRSPGTIDDRARDVAPDGVPFNFYDSGRMDPPRRRFPDMMPRFPGPTPMPMPAPREGLPPRPMPMPPPSIPPGMGPFRPNPFSMPQMPRGDSFRDSMMPAAATIDPSDYRTILKLIEQGLDPEDYIASSGIMSALPQETQMAKLNESQRQALGTRANRFSYGSGESSPQDMLNKIRPLDKQPRFFGLFPGNEANEQDIIDFYRNNPNVVG